MRDEKAALNLIAQDRLHIRAEQRVVEWSRDED